MIRSLSDVENRALQDLFVHTPSLNFLIKDIAQYGGTVYLVGGAVRDCLLLKPSKDIDFEVHGIESEALFSLLARYGYVNEVGRSFGVFKFKLFDSNTVIDWSLPRRDSAGRKPQVSIDPHMTINEALRRRDLTINAMAIDMNNRVLHDPFGGNADLKARILRCPDAKLFVEDPLRFYRVVQFIGRFECTVDDELKSLCATMDLAGVARERIEEELKKLLLQSRTPSMGFRWIYSLGRLQELFPELAALCGVLQSPQWHPEGDVFEHTMQVLDAAAIIAKELHDVKQKLILLYAALCHDLGKASTTVIHPDGKITSYGHEEAGVAPAVSLLKLICGEHDICAAVKKMVRYHMDPGNFLKNGAKIAAYKRLAFKLAPEASCGLLACLVDADKRGRNGVGHEPLSSSGDLVQRFLEQVRHAGVEYEPEKPLIKGEDLLSYMQPGPELGAAVRHAYDLQINEDMRDKELLKKRVLSDFIKKK